MSAIVFIHSSKHFVQFFFTLLAFLVAFLVAMAITGMALGKYYSQTSGSKRKKERVPVVSYLNEDSQELVGLGMV